MIVATDAIPVYSANRQDGLRESLQPTGIYWEFLDGEVHLESNILRIYHTYGFRLSARGRAK
jgi:hypothetical protein